MKAIIIGATSGIGREMAIQMSALGYAVGITGRRSELLDSLEKALSGECFKSTMDLTCINDAVDRLRELLERMGEVDVIVINAGIGSADQEFPLADELETVAVNVAGFTAMANVAYHYFSTREGGHIVGMSSVAALKGGPVAAYNASKAYVSSYLEGLSCRRQARQNSLAVTDIRPGFVDTAMAQGEGVFWKAPVEKAVGQMLKAIQGRRRVVYVTKRWQLIGLLLQCIPFGLYRRMIS